MRDTGQRIRNKEPLERMLALLLLRQSPPEKRGRFWKVLNSPFSLWLLTTVVVGVAGATFTSHNECLGKAEALRTKFDRLYLEVGHRQSLLARAVRDAETPAEVRKAGRFAGTESPSGLIEFSGRSM